MAIGFHDKGYGISDICIHPFKSSLGAHVGWEFFGWIFWALPSARNYTRMSR
jgi:hypothetical protein